MNNVIMFPDKDQRKWDGIASIFEGYLTERGATSAEAKDILPRLKARWENLGKPYDLSVPVELVGPLTDKQLESIDSMLKKHIEAIVERQKEENAECLRHFADLELKIVLLSR